MSKGRLEAFSDGVIAILITIMVLEMKVPHEHDLAALREVAPQFCTYVMSFIYVGIYWNNHHHMLHMTDRINGAILWANLHLLFWLSIIPFTTGWMSENGFAPLPTAFYGANLFLCGTAYLILQNAIVRDQGPNGKLKTAIGNDFKGRASGALNFVAVVFAFFHHWVSMGIFIGVTLLWLAPDPRIEARVRE